MHSSLLNFLRRGEKCKGGHHFQKVKSVSQKIPVKLRDVIVYTKIGIVNSYKHPEFLIAIDKFWLQFVNGKKFNRYSVTAKPNRDPDLHNPV